ncbi:hypothetical protein CEP51_015200 [Fusarium floridanum]|uniref:Uncharacterized protein n=1 Tax=Fusarium floridanum TaxID=1325733 RepID=A0A428PEM6_9HYPO|nr:hypothetical protein CEP51_015200 [Fusarium floridanum]
MYGAFRPHILQHHQQDHYTPQNIGTLQLNLTQVTVCKQSFVGGRTCNEKNEMSEKQCPSCGSKRDVEDEALDVYMRKIGTLFKTDTTNGTEWWQYNS